MDTGQGSGSVVAERHGSLQLPAVEVSGYNLELRDRQGLVGDRATKSVFFSLVASEQKALKEDPFGDAAADLGYGRLDEALKQGEPVAASVVVAAIEAFAERLAWVVKRFSRQKSWKQAEVIVVGGGFRRSRLGEIAIARTAAMLAQGGSKSELRPLHYDPDSGGLIGAAHLAPTWIFSGHDSLIAVDIGGTSIRAGLVALNQRDGHIRDAKVLQRERWRHADEEVGRDEAVDRLVAMIKGLIDRAKAKRLKLAPFIGVGCPGAIEPDGRISAGAQNLPGNWESARFNLAEALQTAIPSIGGHETMVVIHNDAVVQGLSEVPFLEDVKCWAVLTIGTGLGNASFTTRDKEDGSER